MDAGRFDSLTRSLTAALSRRGALHDLARATVAGSLALLGPTETEAKRRRRKRKNKKTRRRGASKCSPSCGTCQTCRGRQCATAADGTPCGGGMICASGACVTGQGTCATGADSCTASDVVVCTGQQTDDDCQCQISIEGDTRCADNFAPDVGGNCGDCGSTAECAGLLPDIPGAFCVQVREGGCCFPGTRGFCAVPCPPAASCQAPDNCPDALNECQIRTCENTLCSRQFVAAGTELPPDSQQEGDCQKLVCDGNGTIRSEPDDSDEPFSFDCNTGTCDNGTPAHVPCCEGEPCGNGGTCDGEGTCVS